MSSDILSGISSDILSAIFWHSIWHSIWRSIWHSIWHIIWHSLRRLRSGREHLAWILAVEVRQGTLGVDGRGWGPVGNTGRGWSRLRSGREHLAWMVAVEVRQGTLGVDVRGWGPAGNTWRGWSRLRSGREHLAWMVVVEVRRRRKAAEGGRRRHEAAGGGRRRRKSTDVKSNNPHLAGGEKCSLVGCSMYRNSYEVAPFWHVPSKEIHIFLHFGGAPCTEIHMKWLTCGTSQVNKKSIWICSLVGCPMYRNSFEFVHFGGVPRTEIHIKWTGSLFLAAWTAFPLESNASIINGIEFGPRRGFSPWAFFALVGGRAFFSLGSEILHSLEDGGIYIYICIYIYMYIYIYICIYIYIVYTDSKCSYLILTFVPTY